MTLKAIFEAIKIAAVANFVSFAAVALVIGGDALNGHAEAGRYYLSSHARLTEVSEAVFIYSLVHAVSVLALLVLAFASEIGVRLIARRERKDFDRATDAMLRGMRARSGTSSPRAAGTSK